MNEGKGKETIRVSVRELVEGINRSGDLSQAFVEMGRALEGIKAHQALQGTRGGNYAREVTVSFPVEFDRFILEVNGRIDGVSLSDEGILIEEIKTTRLSREGLDTIDHPFHWGQLKIYAFVYAEKEGLSEIDAQLTYYRLDTGELREFRRRFQKDELADFFHEALTRYVGQIQSLTAWRELRDASIQGLEFPYPAFRPGQREMAVEVYRAIRERGQLMIQAATGIGKTMAALFPTIKAIAEGPWSKVFYLTARTTGRTVAEKALNELRDKGLKLKSVTLTAKEKICFKEKVSCTPEDCEYARGYYDRIDEALEALSRKDAFSRPVVEELARQHRVCPFEFSLDLSLNADFIICDYNYAFDPRVYLQRFFINERGDYIFLVDEAHNLVHRARDMFSAEIRKQAFLDRRRSLKGELPDIYKCMGTVNSALVKARKRCEATGDPLSEKEDPKELYPYLKDFVKITDRWLAKNERTSYREDLQDLYYSVRGFLKIAELYDERYVTYYEKIGKDLRVKLFCMDPSINLEHTLKRCGVAIFFSATMTPAGYFKKLLGCSESVKSLELGSPFPRENLCILIADGVSTLYRFRDRTKQEVARMIASIANHRKGNYLLFFPSYEYMRMVHEVFVSENPGTAALLQWAGMTEKERDLFLAQFSRENPETLLGFAVMGGIFGEGIDLVGDRLTGAVVVGVGLPGISAENELIREHFEKRGRSGFDYAYLYPGINRVLQAAGRVIRTETDRGVVLLIDERFSFRQYKSLLPHEWQPVRLRNTRQLETVLTKFWGI